MNFKLIPLFLVSILLLISCGSTMQFDQTCVTCIKSQRFSCQGENCPATFMVGGNALVTLIETGENIYMNQILEKEKIEIKAGIPVAIAKIDGKFYVTGNSFKKLWILCPKVPNKAKYWEIDLPIKETEIFNPVFDLYLEPQNIYKLRLTASNYGGKSYILKDDSDWNLFNETKAGE